MVEDQQVFENIHCRHHAINDIALQHTHDAREVTATIGHLQRIVTNFCYAPSGMIRRQDVEFSVRGEIATSLSRSSGPHRALRIVHARRVYPGQRGGRKKLLIKKSLHLKSPLLFDERKSFMFIGHEVGAAMACYHDRSTSISHPR